MDEVCSIMTSQNSQHDTLDELLELSDTLRNKNHKLYLRIQFVIQVVFYQYSIDSTAKLYGKTPPTVRTWVNRYREQGRSGLIDKPRSGAPVKYGPDVEELVVRVALSDPSEITSHISTWSVPLLKRYLKECYDIDPSESTIRRMLDRNGIKFRKVTETLVSNDPEYEVKRERIEGAQQEALLNEDVALLSVDEKGPIHALFHRGKRQLMAEGEQKQVAKNLNKSNGKVVLNAAFEPLSNRFWWHFSEKRNSDEFIMLLLHLILDPYLQQCRIVYLLVDNLRTHFTQSVRDLLDLYPQFKLLRLPTYSPELNPIERVFLDLDNQAIQNHYFSSVEALTERIEAWLLDRSNQPISPIQAVSPQKTRKKRLKTLVNMR